MNRLRLIHLFALCALSIQAENLSGFDCLSLLTCDDPFGDTCRWIYVKANYHLENPGLWRDITSFSRSAAEEDGGSGSVAHPSLMGVSYEPGHGPLASILPPWQRWVQQRGGDGTPFTWVDKDGKRYEFDPAQAIYKWWTGKEFTMLSQMLNPIDGMHLRTYFIMAFVLGGSYGIRAILDHKDLKKALHQYPFLKDLNKEGPVDKDLEAAIIHDVDSSVTQYRAWEKRYAGVRQDIDGVSALLKKEEAELLQLVGGTVQNQNLQVLKIIALKKLILEKKSFPLSQQKVLDKINFALANPSFFKLRERMTSDFSSDRGIGYGLLKKGPLGSQVEQWNNGQAVYWDFTSPAGLQALYDQVDAQEQRNAATVVAAQRYTDANAMKLPAVPELVQKVLHAEDKSGDPEALGTIEMNFAYKQSQARMLEILGLVQMKKAENGNFVRQTDAENEQNLYESLLEGN